MSRLLIGFIIVIVIIIVAIVLALRPKWVREAAMSYVNAKVGIGKDSSDGNIVYLGTFTSQDQCEAACAKTNCNGYTWHNGNGGAYANTCYGVKNMALITRTPSTSGVHQSAHKEAFEPDRVYDGTFSNTLARRAGMADAGHVEAFSTKSCVGTFDCMRDNFTSVKDVATGTNWSGYYGPAAH